MYRGAHPAVFVICSKLYVKRMRKITHNIRDKESAVQSTIQECLQHVLIIKTLRRAVMAAERLHNLQNTLHKEVIHKTRYSTLSSGLINAGFAIGYFATFTWGVFSLQSNVITYGALIAFIQLVGQIQSPVRTLSKFVPIFIEAFTAAERIMEIEQIQQEKQRNQLALQKSSPTLHTALASRFPTSHLLIPATSRKRARISSRISATISARETSSPSSEKPGQEKQH